MSNTRRQGCKEECGVRVDPVRWGGGEGEGRTHEDSKSPPPVSPGVGDTRDGLYVSPPPDNFGIGDNGLIVAI